MDKDTYKLARQVGGKLLSHGLKVTCAESCTGGGLSQAITDVPGSSRWFDMGFVTYADRAKQQLLGVASQSLHEFGAVSEAVAREMAAGALRAANADVSVAITGIAGPNGGTADKPVGLVWFAWAVKGGRVSVLCDRFEGDRAAIRRQAVMRALHGLDEMLA